MTKHDSQEKPKRRKGQQKDVIMFAQLLYVSCGLVSSPNSVYYHTYEVRS